MKKLLMVLTLLTAVPTILLAQTAKALYCADNKTLYFVYDDVTYTAGTSTYTPDDETDARTVTAVYTTGFLNGKGNTTLWYEKRDEMTTADFQSSFAACRPTSTAFWFYYMTALTTINHIENLNTSGVMNMSAMFRGCSMLTSLNLSSFVTSNVTDMSRMFQECSGLTSLDVTKFNTTNVTNMLGMFNNCSRLTSLNVTHFNTSNVTNMQAMFYKCSGLTELNVSNFDTSNVKDMYRMFYKCSGLTSLDVSNFNTSIVTDMSGMFRVCSGLTSLVLSSFDTSNVTDMSGMFRDCSGLTSLVLSNFNTSNVTNMSDMFYGCSGLKSLTFGADFAKKSSANAQNTFSGSTTLRFIDFSNSEYNDNDNAIKEVNRSTLDDMFYQAPNTAVIYLPKDSPAPSGDTQNVVYTSGGKLVCDDYYSEDMVDIELPHDFKTKKAQYSRTMSRKYGTVILPYDFTSNDDIQCYTMTQEHTKTMYFVPTQTVPAHTPFLFEKKSSGDKASFTMQDANYGITVYATRDTSVPVPAELPEGETEANYGPYEVTYDNIKAQEKVGSADGETMTWTTRGYYVNQTVADFSDTYYIASDKFYLADGKLTLYPHRATFVGSWKYGLSGGNTGAPFLNIGIIGADGEEQELTAIESAELFNTVNGISAIFDAQGRRLQQLQPGLNIVHMEDGTVRKVMGK